MVKLDMFCGLLGSGKTTLIKRMLQTAYVGSKVAIIENEFGKVNLDAAELESASIQVKELSSGCICCTIKGDLSRAVGILIQQENPDYIIVEASGVADLRSLLQVCGEVEGITINRVITVVNGKKILKLLKIIGNFFMDQIRVSNTIYLNFCEGLSSAEVEAAENALREINPELSFVSTSLDDMDDSTFPDKAAPLPALEKAVSSKAFGRLAVGRTMGNVRRGGASTTLNVESWDCSFSHSFTEEQIQKLMELFRDESHHTLWRAKGYLEMEDGSVRKVDYTFGDSFEESRDIVPEENRNLLVLIGQDLDTDWLEQQFEAMFAV